MKITGFRVTNYKSIINSGWIDLENLTVLVGKNESGKTSLLRALHKVKPFTTDPYVIDREWPRGRRQSRDPKAVVCSIKFVLEDVERAELVSAIDPSRFDEPIIVHKSYDGTIAVDLPLEKFPNVPPQQQIEELFAPIGTPRSAPTAIFEHLQQCGEMIRRMAYEGRFDEIINGDDWIRANLLPRGAKLEDQGQADLDFLNTYIAGAKQFASALKALPTVRKLVTDFVAARIPTFIYMDDYRAFRGTARLDQVYQRKQSRTLTDEDGTLMTIMTLAGLDLDQEFSKGQTDNPDVKEQRQYDLSDASLSLTNQIAERWKQRRYVKWTRILGPVA